MQASQTSPLHCAVLLQDPGSLARGRGVKKPKWSCLKEKAGRNFLRINDGSCTAFAERYRWPQRGAAPDRAACNTNTGTCGTATLPGPCGTCSGIKDSCSQRGCCGELPLPPAGGCGHTQSKRRHREEAPHNAVPREGHAAGPGAARPQGLHSRDTSQAGHGVEEPWGRLSLRSRPSGTRRKEPAESPPAKGPEPTYRVRRAPWARRVGPDRAEPEGAAGPCRTEEPQDPARRGPEGRARLRAPPRVAPWGESGRGRAGGRGRETCSARSNAVWMAVVGPMQPAEYTAPPRLCQLPLPLMGCRYLKVDQSKAFQSNTVHPGWLENISDVASHFLALVHTGYVKAVLRK